MIKILIIDILITHCIILDNVGMYSTFGMPDEDRPWDKYFEGKEIINIKQISTRNNNELIIRERRTDEGNEEMILIQNSVQINDNNEYKNSEKNIIEEKKIIKSESKETKTIKNILPNKKESIHIMSKSFCFGKYKIEENEDGFFLVNIRNEKKTFLTLRISNLIGDIFLITDNIKKTYTIIKTIPSAKGNKNKEIIIGILKKEGQLMRFTSSDNNIKDKNVTI